MNRRMIMVYCRSGRRSKQAASKLVKLGYSNIVEIGGIPIGLQCFKIAKLALMPFGATIR